MMAAVTASLKERTGRTLEDWVEEVHKAGLDPLDQKSVRRWLKDEHGFGHGHANALVLDYLHDLGLR